MSRIWQEMIFLLMASYFDSESAKIVVPAAVALAVGGLAQLVSWLKDWNSLSRRKQFLEEAQERIEFWDSWSKAIAERRPLTVDETELVEKELTRSSQIVSRAFINWPTPENVAEYREYLKTVSTLRRLLMLYAVRPNYRGLRRFVVLIFLFLLVSVLTHKFSHSDVPFIPYRMMGTMGDPPGPWVTTQSQRDFDINTTLATYFGVLILSRIQLFWIEAKWLKSDQFKGHSSK
jgi:hypothetical protein